MLGIQSLKNKGRFGDTELAHVTPGEVVLPPNFLEENPKIKKAIENILEQDETLLSELTVGSDMASINPETGLPEFFLKKIGRFWNKKVKPIVNKVAKVAKFVPGPWQLPAQAYDTGRVAINVAKGDQDPMALVRNLGQAYAFTNIGIKDGKLVNPSDKFSTDAIGGRTRDFFRSKFGGGADAGTGDVPKSGSSFGVDEVGEPIVGGPTKKAVEETKKNIFQKVLGGGKDALTGIGSLFGLNPDTYEGDNFFKDRILDDLLGLVPGKGGVFGSLRDTFDPSKGGLDPKLLALATAYGKATQKQLEKELGGLKDYRDTLRPDLKVQTPYSTGFDLGLAKGGLASFAKGGQVVGEADYATGGPAEENKFNLLISPDGLILEDSNAAVRQQSIFGKVMRSLEDIPDRDFDAYVEAVRKGQVKDDLSDRAVYVETGKPVNEPDPNAPFKMPLRTAYDNYPEIFELAVKYVKKERETGKAKGGIMETDEASEFSEGGKVLDMRPGGESIGPGTGTSDDIPAMLSDGEFVMTAKANMGAGGVKVKKKKGGIMEIVPSLEPDRKRGADNMMKLMRFFEGVA